MMKKILELYCEEANLEGVPLTPVVEKLDYHDYCFASRRKAGPWVPLEELENVEPCKKLLFGVEICADHGEGGGKIKKILEEKPKEELELLSPSLEPQPILPEQTLIGVNFIKEQTDEEKVRLNEENARLRAENLKVQNKNKKIREYNARVEKLKVKIEKEKARKLKENPNEKIDDDQFRKEQIDIENARIERKNAAIRKENARIEREKPHKEKVKIDIHLVPSAGFYPTALSIAARKGGYCFNCDGWNKGLKDGINRIEAWFEGPEYEKGTMKNPVTPHTAIAKGGGVPLDMKEFELSQDKKIKLESVIDRALGEGILNRWGLGELHVYDPLDLPKNPEPEAKKQNEATQAVQNQIVGK
jgi:hypothetical protein